MGIPSSSNQRFETREASGSAKAQLRRLEAILVSNPGLAREEETEAEEAARTYEHDETERRMQKLRHGWKAGWPDPRSP